MKKLNILILTGLILTIFSSCSQAQEEKKDKKTEKQSENKQRQSSNNIIKKVSIEEAQELIADKDELQIIDLRTDGELENGKLKGAVQINFNAPGFEKRIKTLDTSQPYLIYCHAGGRSGKTLEMMQSNGFTEVYDMSAGFSGWSQKSLPLEKVNKNIKATKQEIENYNSKIQKEGTTFVNFYATWCGVCKKNRPLLNDYVKNQKDITLVEYDVDQNKGLKNHLDIKVVPTLLIYQDGKLTKTLDGALTKENLQ